MKRTTEDALRICVRSLQRASEALAELSSAKCRCLCRKCNRANDIRARRCRWCGNPQNFQEIDFSPPNSEIAMVASDLYHAAERLLINNGYRRKLEIKMPSALSFAAPDHVKSDALYAHIDRGFKTLQKKSGGQLKRLDGDGNISIRAGQASNDNGMGYYHGKMPHHARELK